MNQMNQMNQILAESTDKLIWIYRQVHTDYRWKNSSSMNNLIALSHIMNDKDYSKQNIDRVNEYIKGKTGSFSCYRQKSILFSALLVLGFSDPENKFDALKDYEQRLKDAGFCSYTYRPVTAYSLLLTCEEAKIDEQIAKAYKIFTEMRKDHPWLTSGDDYPLSVLLASSKDSVETIMKDIGSLYYTLHEVGLSRGNGLQFMSHILSLSAESKGDKATRCRMLYDYFKKNELKIYSTNYGALGLLTLLAEKSQEVAQEVLVVSNYLRENRSIRWLGKETLFLTATALVSTIFLQKVQNNNALIETKSHVTVENIIAAQTAAMLGATCAVTAVASNN